MTRQKRQRESVRDSKDDDKDRLSDLPDGVLLHIMECLNIKQAVRTCVLSKRWKNLWKCLTDLKLHSATFSHDYFNTLVSHILHSRNASITLRNLDFSNHFSTDISLMKRVMDYAVSHNIELLAMEVTLSHNNYFELPPSILSCRSLTYLSLMFLNSNGCANRIICPQSLELPALKILHLSRVTFSKSENGCVEPFSTCSMLNNLVLDSCSLQSDATVLCITNSKLSDLIMMSSYEINDYKVVLSTPELRCVFARGCLIRQLSAACNFPFLEELHINLNGLGDTTQIGSGLICWLQVLANVRKLELCSTSFKILNDLLNIGSSRTQAPYFARLESLKLKTNIFANIFDPEVIKAVKCLLQNSHSPETLIDIIKC